MAPPAKERFLVVSSYFPPLIGGVSTVVTTLLAKFRPETFSVIAESPSSFDGDHHAPPLPGVKVTRIGVPALVSRKLPYGVKLARWLRFGMVPRIEQKILAAKPERIIAFYPSWPFFIAAYRAHLRCGAPLVTYHMDAYPDAEKLAWPDKPAVKFYQEKILRAAGRRLVITEAIVGEFQRAFGLDSIFVPHAIDLTALPPSPPPPPQVAAWKGKFLIVHTGVVESLQREGLCRISSFLARHPDLNAKLVLSTPNSHTDLRRNGLDPRSVEILTLSPAEVLGLQRAANVLLAVLPFFDAIKSYNRTVYPTKTVEYLASGVPICAHVPADSYYAGHVRRHGYAFVADDTSDEYLRATLLRLMNDQALRDQLVSRAHAFKSTFDINRVAPLFAEACQIDLATLRAPPVS